MKQKITLLIIVLLLVFSTESNAQNYGVKTTGTWADGFFSDEINTLLSSQSAFTIEFWYQIESFTPNTWVFRVEATPTNRIGILTAGADNGTVFVRVGNGTSHGQQPFATANDLKYPGGAVGASTGHHLTQTEGLWNHVALTFNSGTVKLFIDGLEVEGGAITGAYPATTGNLAGNPFQIGWSSGVNIDEIRITKGTAITSPNPNGQLGSNFHAYFKFNGNEKPVGEAAGFTLAVNSGSDNTVKGYINNFGKTYLVTDNGNTTLKVEDYVKAEALTLYPNPAKGIANISLPDFENGTISVFSITGKMVMQKTIVNQKEIQVNTSTLAKGMYVLEFNNKTTKRVNKLIVN